MGKIQEKILADQMKRDRDEIIERLFDLKNNPEGDGAAISVQELKTRLEDMIAEIEEKLSELVGSGKGWDFSREKAERVFAEDGTVRLRPFSEEDGRFYELIREQNSSLNFWISKERIHAVYQEEVRKDTAFFCVIERISDGAKLGYISLKNTSKDLWEIAIELERSFCRQGYGAEAIPLFLKRVREITGRDQYQFLVEVDNLPCQGCMKKVGAALTGLFRFVFDTEPRKLLSHVLDYRLTL